MFTQYKTVEIIWCQFFKKILNSLFFLSIYLLTLGSVFEKDAVILPPHLYLDEATFHRDLKVYLISEIEAQLISLHSTISSPCWKNLAYISVEFSVAPAGWYVDHLDLGQSSMSVWILTRLHHNISFFNFFKAFRKLFWILPKFAL